MVTSFCLPFLADLDLVLGASGFHVSNPPVLSSVLLRASLSVFSETSMSQLCAKSRLLTGYLEMLIEQNLVRERRVESESKSEGGEKKESFGETVTLKRLHVVYVAVCYLLLHVCTC